MNKIYRKWKYKRTKEERQAAPVVLKLTSFTFPLATPFQKGIPAPVTVSCVSHCTHCSSNADLCNFLEGKLGNVRRKTSKNMQSTLETIILPLVANGIRSSAWPF